MIVLFRCGATSTLQTIMLHKFTNQVQDVAISIFIQILIKLIKQCRQCQLYDDGGFLFLPQLVILNSSMRMTY